MRPYYVSHIMRSILSLTLCTSNLYTRPSNVSDTLARFMIFLRLNCMICTFVTNKEQRFIRRQLFRVDAARGVILHKSLGGMKNARRAIIKSRHQGYRGFGGLCPPMGSRGKAPCRGSGGLRPLDTGALSALKLVIF